MKFTTTKEQVLRSVLHIERIAGKSKELPILSCIHLSVSDGELILRGTNLEIGVEYKTSVKNSEEGSVAVSAHTFSQIVTSAPQASVIECEKKEKKLIVRIAGSVARITTHNEEDFPIIPQVENPKEIHLSAQSLVSVLKGVVEYTSTSTIKPELASVFVTIDGEELVSAATDSFRLAEKRVSVRQKIEFEPLLIPTRSVYDLVYILESEKEDVTIVRNDHQFALLHKGVYATFRLTSGNFPAYEQVIPKDFCVSATVLVSDLESILKKHAIFLDKFYKTTLTVSVQNSLCQIDTGNDAVGDSHDEIHATIEGEEDISVSFNQKYLLDSLHQIPTDACMLRFTKVGGPLLVTPVSDASFRYVVMPMNR